MVWPRHDEAAACGQVWCIRSSLERGARQGEEPALGLGSEQFSAEKHRRDGNPQSLPKFPEIQAPRGSLGATTKPVITEEMFKDAFGNRDNQEEKEEAADVETDKNSCLELWEGFGQSPVNGLTPFQGPAPQAWRSPQKRSRRRKRPWEPCTVATSTEPSSPPPPTHNLSSAAATIFCLLSRACHEVSLFGEGSLLICPHCLQRFWGCLRSQRGVSFERRCN